MWLSDKVLPSAQGPGFDTQSGKNKQNKTEKQWGKSEPKLDINWHWNLKVW